MERLYIKDISKELNYQDRRTIQKWCKNNHVRILCDIGSNRQFVLKEEFTDAINKLYDIKNKSEKYFLQNIKTKKEKEYQPIGEHEKNFLIHLQNY
jgi:hypothetical protein